MRALLFLPVFAAAAMAATHKIVSEEFLQEIREKATTWTPRRNFAEDTPPETLASLANLRGRHPNPNFTLPMVKHPNVRDQGGSFDSRSVWPECASLKTIRNQGACGGCWAFSAVEVMSDRLCIFTAGAQNFVYSPEELISCCSECGFGCGGGYMLSPYQYWQSHGIVSGGDQDSGIGCRPFTARDSGQTPGCNQVCVNGANYNSDLRHGIAAYEVTPTVDQIQHEISINGPVGALFRVFEDFYSYGNGVYQHTTGGEVGLHAVKIIGWGEDNGLPYWIVANSWGGDWGEQGFFRIVRGSNNCDVESSIPAGIPNTSEKA